MLTHLQASVNTPCSAKYSNFSISARCMYKAKHHPMSGSISKHLEVSGGIWVASGRHLGSILGHLGSIRKHLGSILEASGDIWKHLEAYGNIWAASGSICKASGGIWEASGLLDGASPEAAGEPPERRRRTGYSLVGDVDVGFRKRASLTR